MGIVLQNGQDRTVPPDGSRIILQEKKMAAVEQIAHAEHVHGVIAADAGGKVCVISGFLVAGQEKAPLLRHLLEFLAEGFRGLELPEFGD